MTAQAQTSAESAAPQEQMTAQVQTSAESAAPQEPVGPQAPAGDEETTAQVMVPMNAEGECDAVARVSQRDLTGCLASIRASGQQVVGGRGMLVSSIHGTRPKPTPNLWWREKEDTPTLSGRPWMLNSPSQNHPSLPITKISFTSSREFLEKPVHCHFWKSIACWKSEC